MFDLEGTDFSYFVTTNEDKCACGVLNFECITATQTRRQNLQTFPWQVTETFYKQVLTFSYRFHPPCHFHDLCQPNRNTTTK